MAFIGAAETYTKPINNTGKGANEPFPVGTPVFSGAFNEVDLYAERLPDGLFVNYFGDFIFDGPGNIVGGTVDVIYVTTVEAAPDSVLPDGALQVAFERNSEDEFAITELLKPQSAADFYAYLFRFDDTILGTPFKDKLNGWAGNDSIYSGPGNDKQWGGPGKDTFYILEGDDKDKVKDFSKKKDAFVFDRDLVKNLNKLKKIAEQKKKKVVVDFGDGDKLTVDDIKLKKFLKSDFSFLEIDV